MMKRIKSLWSMSILSIVLGCAVLAACGGDDAPATSGGGTTGGETTVVSVTTDSTTNVVSDGAVLYGTVTGLASGQTCGCGFAYSTSPTGRDAATKVASSNTGNGRFTVSLSSLSNSMSYYFWAYVLVDGKYTYGTMKSFITKGAPVEGGTIGQPVDMGLSVKWADHNVGATNPEDAGKYYAWGEIDAKSVYNESTYKYYNATTKSYIKIDSIISGTQYDVAHMKWGGKWRMPTQKEISELMDFAASYNVTKFPMILNGVRVVKLTSNLTGNYIYLPLAGRIVGSSVIEKGSEVHYWSGIYGNVGHAYDINLQVNDNLTTITYRFDTQGVIYAGACVRPVQP